MIEKSFFEQIHSVFNQPSILGDLLPHLQNQVRREEGHAIDPPNWGRGPLKAFELACSIQCQLKSKRVDSRKQVSTVSPPLDKKAHLVCRYNLRDAWRCHR